MNSTTKTLADIAKFEILWPCFQMESCSHTCRFTYLDGTRETSGKPLLASWLLGLMEKISPEKVPAYEEWKKHLSKDQPTRGEQPPQQMEPPKPPLPHKVKKAAFGCFSCGK